MKINPAVLIINSLIGLLLVVMGVFMLFGRGAFLIAGYNTMSKEKKARYDEVALCKFMGKIIIPIGLTMPVTAFDAPWLHKAYSALTLGLALFAVVYANTGNRFRR